MKCENCGAELPEDSIFCENCGSRVDVEIVYCTYCGRKCTSDDVYCENCGTRLTGPGPEERLLPSVIDRKTEEDGKESEKKPPALRWIAAAAAVFALAALAVVSLAFWGQNGEQKQVPPQLLYYQDQSLYLLDLARMEEGPAEITDRLTRGDGEMVMGTGSGGDVISEDGRYLFYREDYDGETFDLYCRNLQADEEPVRIDSLVSQYRVLKDHTVLYVKRESLYYFNGTESVRIGRNLVEQRYLTDEKERNLIWQEKTGKDSYRYYFQDLAGQKEKVRLEENVRRFFAGRDLTGFLVLKYDNLYQVDQNGNKKRIAGNVIDVVSWDVDKGVGYYLTESPARASYEDIIYEDLAMSEEDWERLHELGRFQLPYAALYYYDGAEGHLVSDRIYTGDSRTGRCESEAGVYCLYMEGPKPGEIQVNWSQFRDGLEDEDFGDRVLRQAVGDGLFDGVKLAAGDKNIGGLKDADFLDREISVWSDEDCGRLYVTVTDAEEEEEILYETSLSGSGAGHMEELDKEAYGFECQAVTGDGICYIKKRGPEGGDLFLSGRELDYEVYRAWVMEDGTLLYLADCQQDESGEGVRASLMMIDGGEKKLLMDDVSYACVASDKTAVMLADYDFDRQEGELVYYDGREKHVVAEGVSGFVPVNGSVEIGPWEKGAED